MLIKHGNSRQHSFNMTPLIDIVFLLIIFFVITFQFIETENQVVNIPDDCKFAKKEPLNNPAELTLNVVKNPQGTIDFLVGNEKINALSSEQLTEKITRLLDMHLKDCRKKIITLRIDKDISLDKAQFALAAVAQSQACDIQLAVFDKKTTPK